MLLSVSHILNEVSKKRNILGDHYRILQYMQIIIIIQADKSQNPECSSDLRSKSEVISHAASKKESFRLQKLLKGDNPLFSGLHPVSYYVQYQFHTV